MNMPLQKSAPNPYDALSVVVGVAAMVAPALHSLTDIMEWHSGGFSTSQLWLNYAAFLPMPWLLLGIYAIHDPRPAWFGLLGALLYGAAFTYFSYTTLLALDQGISNYETLWDQLGGIYTFHGALMVFGGILFSWAALRARWLPRTSILLFLSGIIANLLLSMFPLPDILQTVGSAIRNLGLMAMGYAILFKAREQRLNNSVRSLLSISDA